MACDDKTCTYKYRAVYHCEAADWVRYPSTDPVHRRNQPIIDFITTDCASATANWINPNINNTDSGLQTVTAANEYGLSQNDHYVEYFIWHGQRPDGTTATTDCRERNDIEDYTGDDPYSPDDPDPNNASIDCQCQDVDVDGFFSTPTTTLTNQAIEDARTYFYSALSPASVTPPTAICPGTGTATATHTVTTTASHTPTLTATDTPTATATHTLTPTATATHTETATHTHYFPCDCGYELSVDFEQSAPSRTLSVTSNGLTVDSSNTTQDFSELCTYFDNSGVHTKTYDATLEKTELNASRAGKFYETFKTTSLNPFTEKRLWVIDVDDTTSTGFISNFTVEIKKIEGPNSPAGTTSLKLKEYKKNATNDLVVSRTQTRTISDGDSSSFSGLSATTVKVELFVEGCADGTFTATHTETHTATETITATHTATATSIANPSAQKFLALGKTAILKLVGWDIDPDDAKKGPWQACTDRSGNPSLDLFWDESQTVNPGVGTKLWGSSAIAGGGTARTVIEHGKYYYVEDDYGHGADFDGYVFKIDANNVIDYWEACPIASETATITATQTTTATDTPTATATVTHTVTDTPTATETATSTATGTSTATATHTLTPTATVTHTETATHTATETAIAPVTAIDDPFVMAMYILCGEDPRTPVPTAIADGKMIVVALEKEFSTNSVSSARGNRFPATVEYQKAGGQKQCYDLYGGHINNFMPVLATNGKGELAFYTPQPGDNWWPGNDTETFNKNNGAKLVGTHRNKGYLENAAANLVNASPAASVSAALGIDTEDEYADCSKCGPQGQLGVKIVHIGDYESSSKKFEKAYVYDPDNTNGQAVDVSPSELQNISLGQGGDIHLFELYNTNSSTSDKNKVKIDSWNHTLEFSRDGSDNDKKNITWTSAASTYDKRVVDPDFVASQFSDIPALDNGGALNGSAGANKIVSINDAKNGTLGGGLSLYGLEHPDTTVHNGVGTNKDGKTSLLPYMMSTSTISFASTLGTVSSANSEDSGGNPEWKKVLQSVSVKGNYAIPKFDYAIRITSNAIGTINAVVGAGQTVTIDLGEISAGGAGFANYHEDGVDLNLSIINQGIGGIGVIPTSSSCSRTDENGASVMWHEADRNNFIRIANHGISRGKLFPKWVQQIDSAKTHGSIGQKLVPPGNTDVGNCNFIFLHPSNQMLGKGKNGANVAAGTIGTTPGDYTLTVNYDIVNVVGMGATYFADEAAVNTSGVTQDFSVLIKWKLPGAYYDKPVNTPVVRRRRRIRGNR